MKILDPLKDRPGAELELFKQMARLGVGFPTDHVVGACQNLMLNALRQAHATRDGAMNRIDQMMAEMKALLAQHYDLTGKRLNGAFPFHQTIEPVHFDARVKIKE